MPRSMYKKFTLKNLQDVRSIVLDTTNHTLSMSTGHENRNDLINMSPLGGQDDKTLFYGGTESMWIVVRLIEEITQKKFDKVNSHLPHMIYYLRKE